MRFSLGCPYCGARLDDAQKLPVFCACGRRAGSYRFESEGTKDPGLAQLQSAKSFRELMPLLPIQERIPPDFNMPFTPFRQSQRIGPQMGLPSLFWKDESATPSGSFKWRQAVLSIMEVSRRKEKSITVASTGNMALSFSKAAVSFGITCLSFIPAFTPPEKITLIQAFGGTPVKIEGSIDTSRKFIEEIEKEMGWISVNTTLRPFLLEACKTTGLEIALQSQGTLPQKIFIPTGSGLHLAGIAKGIREAVQIGLVAPQNVQFFAVQSSECAPYLGTPIRRSSPPFAGALYVSEPPEKDLFKTLILESGGAILKVSKRETLEAQNLLARQEGLFIEPSGAVSFAGLRQLMRQGLVDPLERVACVLTGSGYHDLKSARTLFSPAVTIRPTIDDLQKKVLKKGRVGDSCQ